MDVFDTLTQHQADYVACWAAFDAASNEAKAITKAAEERISSEREQTESRIVELESQMADASRSATVQRLAAEEMERLQMRSYAVTAAERAAFDEQIAIAEQAISDAKKICEAVRAAINAAKAEIDSISKDILGDQRRDLAQRWLEGHSTAFKRVEAEIYE